MNSLNSQRENFDKLYLCVLRNPGVIYKMAYGEDIFEASFDRAYEVENGFNVGEEEYEEFFALRFNLRLEDGSLNQFEITYRDMPDRVWCNGTQIL